MEFLVKSTRPETLKTATLVVALGEGRKLGTAAKALDDASSGHLGRAQTRRHRRQAGPDSAAAAACRASRPSACCCLGSGKGELSDRQFRRVVAAAHGVLKNLDGSDAVLALGELKIKGRDAYGKARLLVEAWPMAAICSTSSRARRPSRRR